MATVDEIDRRSSGFPRGRRGLTPNGQSSAINSMSWKLPNAF
jgi:hypothetical protein